MTTTATTSCSDRGAPGLPLHRSIAAAVLALCAVMLTGTPSRADTLQALRSELLDETAHVVNITLHPGHATLRVRRTVYNGGPRHDQATFVIDVAYDMVATGLRSLGRLNGRPWWFEGELLEADLAAERYRELTGIGAAVPKDPALLSWEFEGKLSLQVFPCPPQEKKSVEYTLQAPTEYRDGAHVLTLPILGLPGRPAQVTAQSGKSGYRVLLDGRPLRWLESFEAKGVELSLEQKHPGHNLDGRLAVVPIHEGRVLTRYEFEAPPKLSTVPRWAHIVLVIDGSRSFAGQADSALAALDGYLSHFEATGAAVQTIVFDREVRQLHPRFVSTAAARTRLRFGLTDPKNGSAVDLALAHAARLLDTAPPGAERRIVLVTDTHTRSALQPQQLHDALGNRQALVHIVQIWDGTPSLRRQDEHAWAPVARATGGVYWEGNASRDTLRAADSTAEAVFEELARPLRVHHLRMHSTALAPEQIDLEADQLDEGQGMRDTFLAERAAPGYVVSGELWATPVRLSLISNPQHQTLWSALVFGSDLRDTLSAEEMMTLALRGGAVSPVTSYLAIEPGVRPSTDGIARSGVGVGAGFGSGYGIGSSHGSSAAPRQFDAHEYLRAAVTSIWSNCGGTPGDATVTLETTLEEIVAVDAQLAYDNPIQHQCLSTAIWELALPDAFRSPWVSWNFTV